MVNEGRLREATHARTWTTSQAPAESKQLSAAMVTTLAAELEDQVPRELVAEIVRAVLDESRQVARDRSVEFPMLEARVRLERFIRARSAS